MYVSSFKNKFQFRTTFLINIKTLKFRNMNKPIRNYEIFLHQYNACNIHDIGI